MGLLGERNEKKDRGCFILFICLFVYLYCLFICLFVLGPSLFRLKERVYQVMGSSVLGAPLCTPLTNPQKDVLIELVFSYLKYDFFSLLLFSYFLILF